MGYRVLNAKIMPRMRCRELRSDESPELVFMEIPRRNKKFAYDPNSMALMQVDSYEDYLQLKNNPPSPHIMSRYKPVFSPPGAVDDKVGTLVLEATHSCNLSCKYCFVSLFYQHKTESGDMMSFATAKRAIDDLVNTGKEWSVGFFGGEPMLNWPLVQRVIEYSEALAIEKSPVCRACGGSGSVRGQRCLSCRGSGRKMPGFHMTTNGTFYTPERVDFLNEHGFSLITSIDGGEEAHNENRPFRDGRGSWDKVIRGLERLKGLPLAGRNTLRSTFPAISCQSIADRLEFLNQLCDEQMGSWVSVEPVAVSEDSPFKLDKPGLEIHVGNVWELFEEAYLQAADWWIGRAREGKTPRFHNVGKLMERVLYSIHSASECFSGDTKVSLLDGSEVEIQSLVGKEEWFYSIHKGQIIPTKGKGVKTGTNRSLLQVTLDNGEKVKCTPDHLWMLRDGSYRRADQLKPGDSLMPLYRKFSTEEDGSNVVDYEMIMDPTTNSYEFTHRLISDWIDRAADVGPDGELKWVERSDQHVVRHHLDFNRKNNSPDNLCWMKWEDHNKYHQLQIRKLWEQEWFRDMKVETSREWMMKQLENPDSPIRQYLNSDRQIQSNREKSRKQMEDPESKLNQWVQSEENKRRIAQMSLRGNVFACKKKPCPECGQMVAIKGLFHHRVTHLPDGDPLKESLRETVSNSTLKSANDPNSKMYRHLHTKATCSICGKVCGHKGALGTHMRMHLSIPNHKVVSINLVEGQYDTYCIQIQHECHNFALSAGIFVQNCGAGRGYLSVNGKTEIFACHRESNAYLGTLGEGIDEQLRAPWLDNRIYTRQGCMECPIRFICGGGCREDSLGDHGNIHRPSPVHCCLKDLWVKAGFYIMSELPKKVLMKYVRDPGKGMAVQGTLPFLPPEALKTDEAGITIPVYRGSVPISALVRGGCEGGCEGDCEGSCEGTCQNAAQEGK